MKESTARLLSGVRAQRRDVYELAVDLSVVNRVTVDLVRRVRRALHPRATVDTELALWSSPIVDVRTGSELLFRADAADGLRAELVAGSRGERLRCTWEVIKPYVLTKVPLAQHEERLLFLGLIPDEGMRDRTFDDTARDTSSRDEEIERRLASVVAAMRDDENRRHGLAAWVARVMARLPEEVRRHEWAKVLVAAAASMVPTPARLVANAPGPDRLRLVGSLTPEPPKRSWWLRRAPDAESPDGALLVSPRPRTGWLRWETQATPSSVIIDDDRTVALSATDVTRIVLDRAQPIIGTADGHSWMLTRHADHDIELQHAVGRITRPRGADGAKLGGYHGAAYLVSKGVAVTTQRALGDSREHQLSFGDQAPIQFHVESIEHAGEVAFLRLPGWQTSIRPLALGDPPPFGTVCRVLQADLPPSSLAGVMSGNQEELELAEDVAEPGRWLGSPVVSEGRVIGHVVRVAGHRLRLCTGQTVKLLLERMLASRPVVEVVVQQHASRASVRHGVVNEDRILTVLDSAEAAEASFFVGLNGRVLTASCSAYDERSRLAVLTPNRPLGVAGLPIASAFADGELNVELVTPRGHESARMLVKHDVGLIFREAGHVSEVQEGPLRTQREPILSGGPVVVDGSVVALIASVEAERVTAILLTPGERQRLRPRTPDLASDLPSTWLLPDFVSTRGILGIDCSIPGLLGSKVDATPERTSLPASTVRIDVREHTERDDGPTRRGHVPEVEVSWPGESVRCRALGEMIEFQRFNTDLSAVITVRRSAGRSTSFAVRRGMRIAVEMARSRSREARRLRASESHVRFAVQIEGIGALDVCDLADLLVLELQSPEIDVIELFPERDVVELFGDRAAVEMLRERRQPSERLGSVVWMCEVRPGCEKRGRFRWLSSYGPWELARTTHAGELSVRVSGSREHRLTGWVAFHTNAQNEPMRVRADDGLAVLPLKRGYEGLVGAIIERDGVELEIDIS